MRAISHYTLDYGEVDSWIQSIREFAFGLAKSQFCI